MAHLLATNPVALGRLQSEVETVLDGRRMISSADLDQLQYVKCVIKEALRSVTHRAAFILLLYVHTAKCP